MIDVIIVSMGMFYVMAFSVVIAVLQKNELALGYWPIIASAGALIFISEMANIMGFESLRLLFVITTIILFSLVALLKFWDTLELVQH